MIEELDCPVQGCDVSRKPGRAVCERCWFEAPLRLTLDWNQAVRNDNRAAAEKAREAIVSHLEDRRP